jgi:hypothetical protein
MAGMRAASRGATPNPRAEPLLRACLDLVERAYAELEGEAAAEAAMNPASVALKNAIGKLKALRIELSAK